MENNGVVRFYYGQNLPPRAVALAKITTILTHPADLVGINNTIYSPGSLTITAKTGGAVVDAAPAGRTVLVSGSIQYTVENQFFEITDQVDASGTPYYYSHVLPAGVSNIAVSDLEGNAVTAAWILGSGEILHDLDGAPYWVQYYDGLSYKSQLLQYAPIWKRTAVAGPRTYAFNSAGLLTLPDVATYRIRFFATNGYEALPPYGGPFGDPWYVRARFSLRPMPGDWAVQPFQPQRPYQLASWVPGKVLSTNLIELERPYAWFDPQVGQYPDLLVFGFDGRIKYALDGRPVNLEQPANKGYLYPWRTSQIVDMDAAHSRLQVQVDLDPTDVVFGFYAYRELDVVYRAIDLNPFSNPNVKDKVVEFYYADRSIDDPPRS